MPEPKKIQMFGIVGDAITEKTVSEQLPDKGDIVVEVNSNGGSYLVGLAIYNILKKYRDENKGKVTVDILAMAGSAMATIAMAATDAKHRIMREGARLFVHRPWGGASGNSEEFEKRKEELLSIEKDMEIAYSENLGISVEQARKYMKEEKSFTAEEAQELGFATMAKAPKRKIKNYWKELPSNMVPTVYAELKDDEYNPSEVLMKFVTSAWDGSKSRFTVEQLLNSVPNAISALVNEKAKEDNKDVVKSDCKLPYKEPNGNVNINGVRNALARLPHISLTNAIKNSVRNELEAEIQKFKKSNQSEGYNWQSKIEIQKTKEGVTNTFLYSSKEIEMDEKILQELGVENDDEILDKIKELKEKAEKKEDEKPKPGGDDLAKGDAGIKALIDPLNASINALKKDIDAVKAEGESWKKKSEIQGRLLDEASEFKNKSILAERKATLDNLFKKERKITPVQLEQAKADFVDIELDKVGETESLYQYAIKSYKLNKPDESGKLRGSGETPDDEVRETASEEIDAKVKALREKDKELSYKSALGKVKVESPKLFEKYSQEIHRTR